MTTSARDIPRVCGATCAAVKFPLARVLLAAAAARGAGGLITVLLAPHSCAVAAASFRPWRAREPRVAQ